MNYALSLEDVNPSGPSANSKALAEAWIDIQKALPIVHHGLVSLAACADPKGSLGDKLVEWSEQLLECQRRCPFGKGYAIDAALGQVLHRKAFDEKRSSDMKDEVDSSGTRAPS
jgi:hypothetical protein